MKTKFMFTKQNAIGLIALLSLGSLTSCMKETTVTGTVYDLYSKKPAANIKVWLVRHSMGDSRELESTTSDSDGRFYLRSPSKADRVTAYSEHSNSSLSPSSADVQPGRSNQAGLYVTQSAKYIVHIKNTNPVNSQDRCRVWTNVPSGKNDFYGTAVDDTLIMVGTAGTKNAFTYEVTKNGITKSYSPIFLARPDSLLIHEVKY